MIDPTKVTDYDMSVIKLQENILFWVCAAGKNGRTAARCLEKFLNRVGHSNGLARLIPFEGILRANPSELPKIMKECGIGCYNAKARTFKELAKLVTTGELNLRTCTTDDLEKIHGIGMKTSRCFIMHSRKNAQVAGIDTHLLKHLRKLR